MENNITYIDMNHKFQEWILVCTVYVSCL